MLDSSPNSNSPPSPGKAWLQLAWRRKWWLVIGTVVGLAAGATVYIQKPRVYEASTQVLVDRRPLPPSISQQTEAQRDIEDLETHVTLILSPEIADRAAKILAALPGPEGLAFAAVDGGTSLGLSRRTAEPGPYAVEPAAILGGLSVSRDNNGAGRVLTISYRSHSQDEDPRVLHAVVQGYQEFLTEKTSGGTAETLDIMTRAMDTLEGELKAKKGEYEKFRKDNPIIWGRDAAGTRLDRYKIIQDRLTAFLARQIEIEDRLQMAERELQAGTLREAVAEAISRAERTKIGDAADPTRQTREEQILNLRIEEQKLIDAGFGPGYDELRNVRRQIEMLQGAPSGSDPNRLSIPPGGDTLDGWLVRLRQELEEIKSRQSKWEAQMTALNVEQRNQVALETAHETFLKDIENRQQYFDLLLKQLSERKLLGGGGGLTARIISPPGPGRKVAPSLPQSLILGLAMGLAAGAGLAFLSDLLDQSFRGPADVRNRLGLPVLGHLPPLRPRPGADGPVSPLVVAYHSPGSAEAEAVRRVRAALKLRAAGPGPKVLQVTSPDAGAGKSLLAANLAVSLAQSGKDVLLVEADHRHPTLHSLFGIEGGAGFAAALAGVAGPDDAVRPTVVPHLAVVPWGDPAGDPADILTSARFEQLLAAWGGTYPLILIDSPPTLAVHDAVEVANRANGVLLVVPATTTARPTSGRAVTTLRGAGANLLGVVVNLGAKGAGRYEMDRFDRGMPVGQPPGSRGVLVPVIRSDDVRDGLLKGEFFLEYLPTVRLEDGKCVGVEALARWRRPGGVVAPSEFIPRIRNTPVAAMLTRWVVETVAADLGPWLKATPGVHVSVNVPLDVLSQRQIEAVGLRAGLTDLAEKFVVEVTERGTPGRLAADAREAVAARPGEARIALDDVGLDGVDLLSLTRLGVDIVKLDKSVADLLAAEGAAGGVMRQLAGAIRAAAFQVVAEGVETAAQADLLRAAGVKLAQGWLFSKPLRANQFLEYYQAQPDGEEGEPVLLSVRPVLPPADETAVPLEDPDDSGIVDLDVVPAPLTAIAGKPTRSP